MKVLASDHQLQSYLPHRKPFLLVDTLFECSENDARTGFEIPNHHILVKNQKLTTGGLIENLAQSAALHLGYISEKKGIPPRKGYIAAIKNMEIYNLPGIGNQIISHISIKDTIFNVTLIEGSVYSGSSMLAKAELRVVTDQ